jgi:hypothetical protein
MIPVNALFLLFLQERISDVKRMFPAQVANSRSQCAVKNYNSEPLWHQKKKLKELIEQSTVLTYRIALLTYRVSDSHFALSPELSMGPFFRDRLTRPLTRPDLTRRSPVRN